jgi:hypothetical protein
MFKFLSRKKRRTPFVGQIHERHPRFENLEDRRVLATLTVNLPGDAAVPIDDGNLTIREAIAYINSDAIPGPQDRTARIDESVDLLGVNDKIVFESSLAYATIAIGSELSIARSVTIDGRDTNGDSLGITIDAGRGTDGEIDTGDGFRIFSIHVFSESPEVQINSLTLTGGDPQGAGGAIHSFNTNLTVQNSIITGNAASERGGGISFQGMSNITLKASTLRQNYSGYDGGALYARASYGEIKIEQSIIDSNYLTNSLGLVADGAGAYLKSTSSAVTITGTIISNNKALGHEANVGGLFIRAETESIVLFDALQIINNHADDNIGGLVVSNSDSDVRVVNSSISGNTATFNSGPDIAAGVYLRTVFGGTTTTTTIESSTISDNRMLTPTIEGRENRFGGGLYIANSYGATTNIRNSTISGNKATANGGGIKIAEFFVYGPLTGGNVTISHSTITKNWADSNNDENGAGGGIHFLGFGSTVTLDHTIVAGNFRGTESVRDDINGSVTASWSLIGDDTGATITDNGGNQTGSGVAHIDPLLGPLQFNGGPTKTHALQQNSPALDMGDPAAIAGSDPVPLYDQRGEGFTRTFGRIDIGAYEVGLAKLFDVQLTGVQWNGDSDPNDNPDWTRAPYSFAELVPLGQQLAPIYTYGVNTISIHFTEDVRHDGGTMPDGSELTLYKSAPQNLANPDVNDRTIPHTGFSYSPTSHIATWTFPILLGDLYRIVIDSALVEDLNGNTFDGFWENQTNNTPYDWRDDPTGRTFVPGATGMDGQSFHFKFALQPGDYDQNHVVDIRDWEVWRMTNFTVDGTGDGVENADDDDLFSAMYANFLYGTWTGDYDGNGRTDAEDWLFWRSYLGNTSGPGLAADGSGNGEVDAADYIPWRDWTVTWSAWYDGSNGAGSGMVFADSANAPKVMNLTISGSSSTHDPYSFATHVGSGEQLQTVPVGGADTISITFSEQVNVEANYLRVVGFFTYNVPELAAFFYDVATMTASWRFENLIANDIYIISLSDAVIDTQGFRLDGEWTNAGSVYANDISISEFPSGDGHTGGTFNFLATLLDGDADLNNVVNFDDYGQLIDNWMASGAEFTQADFNGDGTVDFTDYQLLVVNYGLDLQGGVGLPGDLAGDFDWLVNDADFAIIEDNFGMTNADYEDGDLNGDGTVDLDDVDLFFAHYGLGLSVVI